MENKQTKSPFENINELSQAKLTFGKTAENLRKLKTSLEGVQAKMLNKKKALLLAEKHRQDAQAVKEARVAEQARAEIEVKVEPVKQEPIQAQAERKPYVPKYQPREDFRRNNNQGVGRQGAYNQNPRFNNSGRPGGFGNNRPGFGQNRPFGAQGQQGQGGRPFNNQNRPQFNRPMGQNGVGIGGFKRKTELEPLPDFIKAGQNRNEKSKKDHEIQGERKTLSVKQKMRFGIIEDDYGNEERMGSRKLKVKKTKEPTTVAAQLTHAVLTDENITVKDFSETISRPVSEIIKKLMDLGMMMTINSNIDLDTAELVASELGVTIERKVQKTFEEQIKEAQVDSEENLVARAPIVTVMGHVDHGKTSLLDAIRKTNVIAGEAGGITQSIGAYSIKYNDNTITFIDTPGHAAFSNMRKRGAQVTDVAILVVAANDGIMPQTVEAIKHIKDANVPMIVAINKIDLQDANIDRVKQQLTEHDVVPEEWGGDTICVPISAKKGMNLDKLIETILLVSEVAELKANPNRDATGTVLEAKLDKNRGSVATLLVQNGTLKIGSTVVAGVAVGKIRAMFDDKGNSVKSAGPSTPVSILGLDDVPSAGDFFYQVDEKMSRQIIEERKNKIKQDRIKKASTSLDDFFARVDEDKLKHLNIIVKADVQGSAEAVEEALRELSNEEVRVCVIGASAGGVTENDVMMAESSDAIIVVFNSKVDARIDNECKRKKIKIVSSKIIYELIEEIEKVVKSMLTPKYTEKPLGKAEVRAVFKLSSGTIAGSYVTTGKIERNAKARVVRNGEVLADGYIETLKIQKDDKKEVGTSFECGIKVSNFTAFNEGDIIECYVLEEIAR